MWLANNVPGHERYPLTDANFNSPVALQAQTLAGLFSITIGFCYVISFYRGYEQWFLLGIPVRIFVGCMGFLVWCFAPGRINQVMFVVCVNDLIGALVCGWLMMNSTYRSEFAS